MNRDVTNQGIEIKSTSDALKYLYNLSLDKSDFRFRGQADFNWTLQPTIHRFNNLQRYQTVEFECNTLLAKPKQPNPPLTHTAFDLEWLMLCQHYDVPTRLLDWTTDILIALFFSCSLEEKMNKDGCIFVCDQNDYPLFAAYNDNARETQELAFISTNIVNPRLRMQSGCFMIWGRASLDEQSTESYDLWQYHEKHGNKYFLTKIRIPKEYKKIILLELDQIYSISNDSLYIKNGFLERQYSDSFIKLKNDVRLMTLYKTDAELLSADEEIEARSLFRVDCRNMMKGCIRSSML